MEYTHVKHTFLPVYNEESRILILGSFPSVKSRENQFYYGHPQNRFWNMNLILSNEKIQGIFANGGKAHQLFVKYCNKEGMPPLGKLPSTSPANAAWNLERLTAEWKTAFGMYLEITE